MLDEPNFKFLSFHKSLSILPRKTYIESGELTETILLSALLTDANVVPLVSDVAHPVHDLLVGFEVAAVKRSLGGLQELSEADVSFFTRRVQGQEVLIIADG